MLFSPLFLPSVTLSSVVPFSTAALPRLLIRSYVCHPLRGSIFIGRSTLSTLFPPTNPLAIRTFPPSAPSDRLPLHLLLPAPRCPSSTAMGSARQLPVAGQHASTIEMRLSSGFSKIYPSRADTSALHAVHPIKTSPRTRPLPLALLFFLYVLLFVSALLPPRAPPRIGCTLPCSTTGFFSATFCDLFIGCGELAKLHTVNRPCCDSSFAFEAFGFLATVDVDSADYFLAAGWGEMWRILSASIVLYGVLPCMAYYTIG